MSGDAITKAIASKLSEACFVLWLILITTCSACGELQSIHNDIRAMKEAQHVPPIGTK